MFERLKPVPIDPILGLMNAFKADPRETKIDLGVGVYQNDSGKTPIMTAVKKAEFALHQNENTKTYQGMTGDIDYNTHISELIFGSENSISNSDKFCTLQAPGGSGALRVGAEVIARTKENATIWIGDPTWANHIPIMTKTGLKIKTYPYYDFKTHSIDFDAMIAQLKKIPAGDFVLLHGCCHNPTGADLTLNQWSEVCSVASQTGFIPFIDIAYQGLGNGLDEDVQGLRILANNLPELMVASSCSKNFGLYRERTGAISFVCSSDVQSKIVLSHAMSAARSLYSMPPAHGALLVAAVLGDHALRQEWEKELEQVRRRIESMRNMLCQKLETNNHGQDISHIKMQKGMFSFLGITPDQVTKLRDVHGIYMVSSTRINIAGININNIDYLCDSILDVL